MMQNNPSTSEQIHTQVAQSGAPSGTSSSQDIGVAGTGSNSNIDGQLSSNAVGTNNASPAAAATTAASQVGARPAGSPSGAGQQQLRSSVSPSHQSQLPVQHQQQTIMPPGHQHGAHGGFSHHRQGGYHNNQRHVQSYHNQHSMHHHQQQQHHYHQQSQHQHHHHHHHHQQQQQQGGKFRNHPRGDSESNANHVLLITIINPQYTVNCDLIHEICSQHGKVNRIVIFKKNGLQAMVEFDNVESARRAKANLNGCEIFTGCCILRIEYANQTRLNVHKNDSESFDYTDPNLSIGSELATGQSLVGGEPATNHPIPFEAGPTGQHQHPISHHNHQQQPHHHHQHQHHDQNPIHAHHESHHHQHRGPRPDLPGGPVVGGAGPGSHHSHAMQRNHHGHQQSQMLHLDQGADEPNYGISGPGPMTIQPHTVGDDSFEGDAAGDFNPNSRGLPGQGGSGGNSSGYPTIDSYLPMEGLHQEQHNPYPRQDSHQHPHQPHHAHHHQQHHHHHHHPHQQAIHHNQHHPHHSHHQHHHNPRSSIQSSHGNRFQGPGASSSLLSGPAVPPQGTVMMVYGLQSDKMSCDRLFNLFCLYGNVVKVKFLRTKEGCAMVQMGDVLAVDRCVSSLNKIILFGGELQISYSKQPFLNDVVQPFELPNGSPSFKDFIASKNNRFKNPELASKNRILPPSQMLHFFNAPFGITEDELLRFFKQSSGHDPVSIKIFTPKAENSKSYSGLVIFKSPAEATETLVLCNHLTIPKPGAPHPYILRLCFSPPTYARQAQYTAAPQDQ